MATENLFACFVREVVVASDLGTRKGDSFLIIYQTAPQPDKTCTRPDVEAVKSLQLLWQGSAQTPSKQNNKIMLCSLLQYRAGLKG